ncbi:caspase family protein [Thiotrichales bacterium HSG1]|nr:caspase family protein [Thiotrichales bacterium HSG1]
MLKYTQICLILILVGCTSSPIPKGNMLGETCSIPPLTNRQCFTDIPAQRTKKNTVFMLAAGANVGDLTMTSSDLKNFSQAMQKRFEIPKSQICQLPNAFTTEMQTALKALNKILIPNDLVIIYFSGHGTQINDDNGDEKDGADEVLVTYDSKCKSNLTKDDNWRDDNFVSSVNSLSTNRILTVMDTCHSAGAILSPNLFQLKNARSKYFVKGIFGDIELSYNKHGKKNFIKNETGNFDSLKGLLLAATGERQKAFEVDTGGLFTTILLDNFSENLRQAFLQTTKYIKQGTRNDQIPQMIGNWKVIEESLSIWDM